MFIEPPPRIYHFWDQLHREILYDLRGAPVLVSGNQDAGFRLPRTLRYVPPRFRFENNALFDLPRIRESHLAFNYDDVRNQLSLLGVQTLTLPGLYEEFRQWIVHVGVEGIAAQSTEWHRKVALVFYGQGPLRDMLSRLPIIPLRDGSWVEAKTEHVFLSSRNEEEHVPTGVAISIVDETASRDPQRNQFFRFLGIEEYSPRQVCDLILELHANTADSLSDRDDGDLIDDLTYLFEHRALLQQDCVPQIVFVVQKGGNYLRQKTDIYIVDPRASPCLVQKYRDTPGNPFPILDEWYEAAICRGDDRVTREFRNWLLRSANSFAAFPILVRNARLTTEWHFLRDRDVIDLLYAVKFYLWTVPLLPTLLDAVPKLRVRCRDGITRPLGGLALPSSELLQKCPHLDFAGLPNSTRSNWGFLSNFNVLTTCNTTARLRELRALSRLASTAFDVAVVHRIYRALSSSRLSVSEAIDQSYIIETDQAYRDAFRRNALVFIDECESWDSMWTTHYSCVWTAPAPLEQVIRLEPRYRDCEKLFCDLLGVRPAVVRHVVDEFCFLSNRSCDDAIQRCGELLSVLQSFFAEGAHLNVNDTRRLKASRAFPVCEAEDSSDAEPNVVLRSLDDGNWYIPDRTTLEQAFRSKVSLLSLPVKRVQSLASVFEELDCQGMLLSHTVTEMVEPHGASIRNVTEEEDLRIRLRYIAGCVHRFVQVWEMRGYLCSHDSV
jgi:hypothetical protein